MQDASLVGLKTTPAGLRRTPLAALSSFCCDLGLYLILLTLLPQPTWTLANPSITSKPKEVGGDITLLDLLLQIH